MLNKRGKVYQAEAAFGDEDSVFIGRKALGGARAGELVVVRRSGRGRGEVARRLGKADAMPAIMEGILTHFNIPRGFSARALEEAEAGAGLAGREDNDRHDLTDLAAFTIDPDEARDYDDAISLEEGPGEKELTLYVHIADVSYYVNEGSALDGEAARKAVSVYLPIAVEPMLPPVLSTDVCSLRPDRERKCVTVEMAFAWPDEERWEGSGVVAADERRIGLPLPDLKKTRFYRSLISSRARLTYNQVDDYFEGAGGRPAGGLEEGVSAILDRSRRLAAALREARHRRGALNIHTFEPEFRLSEAGEVVGVRPRPRSESHALIEEFMIAANEAVADYLERRRDCIYRVHELPDAAAVDALFDLMGDLGIATPPFSLEGGTPEKAGRAVREFLKLLPGVLSEQQRRKAAFGEMVLRSLKQARYNEDNLGHFGLASPAYLHFTSPIRRYPDLVAHRALLDCLRICRWKSNRLNLAQTARQSSENERRAAMVEHTGDDVVLAFLLDRLLFEKGWDFVFDGEIVGLISSGLFVRFEECYEGFVPARKLRGDYFALNDEGSALVGRRSGRPYRLGDYMRVLVRRIDRLRGKVELEPAR